MNDSVTRKLEDGSHEWRNGADRLHRADGPAVVHADGTCEWWINGFQMSARQFEDYRRRRAAPSPSDLRRALDY
jgi:hypothetical protein